MTGVFDSIDESLKSKNLLVLTTEVGQVDKLDSDLSKAVFDQVGETKNAWGVNRMAEVEEWPKLAKYRRDINASLVKCRDEDLVDETVG